MSLSEQITFLTKSMKEFKMKDVYELIPDKPKTTIRARIYDNLGIKFERVNRDVYRTIEGDSQCIVIEGDGRDLSFIEKESVDAIITDHPWQDDKSNKGGSRKFTDEYNCYLYSLKDFQEKYRILKDGSFLVEFIAAENENNYDYIYDIKKMAEKAGFKYYANVAWKKGTFVSNTGRKAKNTENIMIFSKGKARPLRLDAKKTKEEGCNIFMSGTNGMLPTMFDVQAVSKKEKIHQSEKPTDLITQILEYITLEGETVLDNHAGSGVVGEACLKKKRNCILIEILKKNVELIVNRLKATKLEVEV